MRVERAPGEARRRFPELLLSLLVLAGLVNCVNRFVTDGKLPQPFIFDINDTFMDWFNTAYWAHHPGAFDVWKTVYPPLSFVFLKVFGIASCYQTNPIAARDCDYVGRFTIYGCYLLGAGLAWLAFRRADPRTAVFRGIAFACGIPLLFTLERGNLILPCFVCFVLGHGDLGRSRLTKALGLAATINFKPYLLLPVLAHAVKRRWRFLELTGFVTVAVYLVTFAILGDGSLVQLLNNTLTWISFTGALVWEQVYYSTSYAPFLEFNTYRFPTRDFIPSAIIETMAWVIPLLINTSRVLGLICLVGAWLQPRALTTARVSTLLLGVSLIGQSPGGYTEVFLIFLLFLERWERPGPIVALVMGYLLCVPYDLVLSNIVTLTGDSWLSGRTVAAPFGISVGIFLRPGLIVVMIWALALDSILLIARAHRGHQPTLALAPSVVPA